MDTTRPILPLLALAAALQGCTLDFDTAFEQSGAGTDAGLADQASGDTSTLDTSTLDTSTLDTSTLDTSTLDDSSVLDHSLAEASDTAPEATDEQQQCFPGMKSCQGECVSSALPEYGCDPASCSPCALPHATEQCSGSHCAVKECDLIDPDSNPDGSPSAPRWGDCNAPKWDDGCETRLDTTENCGSCGTTCSPVHASGDCKDGTCRIGACIGSYADCDGKAGTGCEVDTDNDVNHCGACGYVCPLQPGATKMTCLSGKCEPDICESGRKDCDGDPGNGCETDITQIDNCGGCGIQCTYPHGLATCVSGACKLAACEGSFADCNGNPGDGCEVDTASNMTHCGACAAPCSSNHGANPHCIAGQCALICDTGYASCEDPTKPGFDLARNGCETNISADAGDPMNCGGCGFACETTNASMVNCASGSCNYVCKLNFGNCNGSQPGNTDDGCEMNLLVDPNNCGACGKACSSAGGNAVCVNGACNTVCDSSHGNCDGNPANGCEMLVSTNVNACGPTCVVCPTRANASRKCTAGVCGFSCTAGYGDCDGIATNGCEAAVSSNPDKCGPSCVACPSGANGSRMCSSGVCGFACDTGYGNCDNQSSNGCETNVTNTVIHCGVCNHPCAGMNASWTCAGGTCQVSGCATGWGNCDLDSADGCEADLLTSKSHCGACGNPCNGADVCVNGVCI